MNLTVVDFISFLSSITSLILAVVAIIRSINSEKDVRENFEKTKQVMAEYQERTKEVLAEIDKKSAVIERTVSDSQRQLLDTMTNIINETVIPKKTDVSEQLGIQFMQQLFANPQQANDMMGALQPFMDMAEKQKGK